MIQDEINNNEEQQEDLSEQMVIRREKLAELKRENKNPYEVMKFDLNVKAGDIKSCFEDYEGKPVKIAGRMMSRRDMGKANFINITDFSDNIQVYIKIDDIGEEKFRDFKRWDIGDILGIEGSVFRTKRGEISIHAYDLKLLSKSLIPLPEKWHGLKDTELRYRQRYLDLIVNPVVKDTFIKRSKIIQSMRDFLNNEGFIEVETPVLSQIAGGAAARPFGTHHNALDLDMNLRISLELYLKRLIVGGFERVYEIGRVFRNEGISIKHNPEFTLMELYQAYTDYNGMMEITERMMKHIAGEVCGTKKIIYGDCEIDFENKFSRMSMLDAVKLYAEVDFNEIHDTEAAKELAGEHGIKFEERHKKGDILNLFFEKYAEDKLIQPTFITGHPVEISPLAKKIPDNPEYTERFELFILGREFGNAFSELNDPIDQRERFENQLRNKQAGDSEAYESDEDFLTAIEYGMPPTGGLGIGVDRFVMLLTNSASIRDVIFFPAMRPNI